jgi:hypothetical protein
MTTLNIPELKASKRDRGWCIEANNHDAVVNESGFVQWFTSRAKAVKAIPAVRYDAENEWLVIRDAA